jgi:hypothetical protein
MRVRATILPTPGMERSRSSFSCHAAVSTTSLSISASINSISFFNPRMETRMRRRTSGLVTRQRRPLSDFAEVFVFDGMWRGLDRFGVSRNGQGVDPVRLCEDAECSGEGSHLTWIDHRHGDPGGGNDLESARFEAAGRFHDDERVVALVALSPPRNQRPDAARGIRDTESASVREDTYIEHCGLWRQPGPVQLFGFKVDSGRVTELPHWLHAPRSNGIPPAHPKGRQTPRIRARAYAFSRYSQIQGQKSAD